MLFKSVPCVPAVDRSPKSAMELSPSVAYTVIESGGVHSIFANRLAGMADLAETKFHVVPPPLAAIKAVQSMSEQHQTFAIAVLRFAFSCMFPLQFWQVLQVHQDSFGKDCSRGTVNCAPAYMECSRFSSLLLWFRFSKGCLKLVPCPAQFHNSKRQDMSRHVPTITKHARTASTCPDRNS